MSGGNSSCCGGWRMRLPIKRILVSMIRFCALLSFLIAPGLCVQGKTAQNCSSGPLYAARAAQGQRSIASRDHTKRLEINQTQDENGQQFTSFAVTAGAQRLSAKLKGWDAEVLWSPQSDAFAVNQTQGGGGIGERTFVYYIKAYGLRRLDISPHINKVFGSPVKCEAPVQPNTATIRWLDSRHLLVAAEIVPVSICKSAGTFITYEVEVPAGRIMRRHTQEQTKQLWSNDLGCELRKASDASALSWQAQPREIRKP